MAQLREAPAPFTAGLLVMTRSVQALAARGGLDPTEYLRRHLSGDWGDISEDDRNANARAIVDGDRLFSSYKVSDDLTLWIITEADRSATTLLLPDDY
jgi:hypothetical protein